MWWVVTWAVVAVLGAAGTVASINNVRFSHRVAREARELVVSSRIPPPVPRSRLAALPPPVQRYLRKAIGGRETPIRTARLRHGGAFRPSLNGSWLAIRGEQFFTADPPAFIWWGRVRIAPGLWIDARDRSMNGRGNMFVTIESTIPVADSSGPQLDQGALLRLLGEMTWVPTMFLDDRYVRWEGIDDRRARATLDVNGLAVSGEFAFGPDDLPSSFLADRYRDVGGGRSVLTGFVGRLSDFRHADGVLAPHRVIGAWIVDNEPIEYANFDVQQLEYE